jgi:hypothetical protein
MLGELGLWYEYESASKKVAGVYCRIEKRIHVGKIVRVEDELNSATLLVLEEHREHTIASGAWRYYSCEVLDQERK